MRPVKASDDYDVQRSRATDPIFYEAPAPENTTPYAYQFAGAEYALNRDNAIVGDAPGLGKTCESILISNAIEAKHTLIVCPASLRLNWEREIWRWSTKENVSTYPILKAKDGVSLDADYVIVSYDMLRNEAILDALLDQRWDHLVLDEAHYLKDPKGNKRTRAICAPDCLPSVVGRITMATGTLLPNAPIECYNAIRLLNWEAINKASLEDFREFYYAEGGGFIRGPVRGEDGTVTWKVHWSDKVRNQPRNLDDLNYRLRKHLMVRRLKEQVLSQLPPKQWHPFPIAMTSAMREAMLHEGWKEAEKLYQMDPHAFDRGVPVDGAISSALRELGEAKAPAVADYIEDLMDAGTDKLVVAAWHHSVLAYLKDRLGKKYTLVYMDGSTSNPRRQAAVDQFQTGDAQIILGQMSPLGEGWTLTAAQDVVFAEFSWVPGRNEQMIDRIHRIGQEGGFVIGHMPVVPGTLDERVLGTAVEKDQYIYEALDA